MSIFASYLLNSSILENGSYETQDIQSLASSIPSEIDQLIAVNLSFKDLLIVELVNKAFNKLKQRIFEARHQQFGFSVVKLLLPETVKEPVINAGFQAPKSRRRLFNLEEPAISTQEPAKLAPYVNITHIPCAVVNEKFFFWDKLGIDADNYRFYASLEDKAPLLTDCLSLIKKSGAQTVIGNRIFYYEGSYVTPFLFKRFNGSIYSIENEKVDGKIGSSNQAIWVQSAIKEKKEMVLEVKNLCDFEIVKDSLFVLANQTFKVYNLFNRELQVQIQLDDQHQYASSTLLTFKENENALFYLSKKNDLIKIEF